MESNGMLNVNRLNYPTKRQCGWLDFKKKKDPNIYYLQEIHFSFKDTNRLKMSEWKMIFHANGNQKKAGFYVIQNRL